MSFVVRSIGNREEQKTSSQLTCFIKQIVIVQEEKAYHSDSIQTALFSSYNVLMSNEKDDTHAYVFEDSGKNEKWTVINR